MKRRNQNALTWILFIFLVFSIILNFLQVSHIEHLRKEVAIMEQLQVFLSTYIDELEDARYEEE